MKTLLERVREYGKTSLWLIPGVMLAGSVGGSVLMTGVDRWAAGVPEAQRLQLAFSGSAEAARSVLSTVATSMLSLTGVVFSITIVVLQLASSQFSPRALRTFLTDLPSKFALGTFLGTFAFSLVALTTVRSESGPAKEFVPGLTTAVAFLLVLASVALFVYYIHHIATKIRVTSIIASIGEETVQAIEERLPERGEEHEPAPGLGSSHEILSKHTGRVVSVDTERMVRLAGRGGFVIEIVPLAGDFVPGGAPLMRLSGELDDETRKSLVASVTLANERTLEQDVAYGFRELTDIALRALSPSLNDPTTAMDVIDAEHDLLLRAGRRGDPPEWYRDDAGKRRVFVPARPFEDYVEMMFGEIGTAGSDFERVREGLRAAACDLARSLPPERLGALRAAAAEWLPPDK